VDEIEVREMDSTSVLGLWRWLGVAVTDGIACCYCWTPATTVSFLLDWQDRVKTGEGVGGRGAADIAGAVRR